MEAVLAGGLAMIGITVFVLALVWLYRDLSQSDDRPPEPPEG